MNIDYTKRTLPPLGTSQLIRQPDFDAGLLHRIAHLKRFNERFTMDEKFRQRVAKEPFNSVMADYQIDVKEETVMQMHLRAEDMNVTDELDRQACYLNQRRNFDYLNFVHDPKVLENCNPHFRHWRDRQIKRFMLSKKAWMVMARLYLPFTVELSSGCTVGCWFCGVSAKEFKGHWPATPENLKLWREILEVFGAYFGDFASRGFLYWATDPMDNPDYHHFAQTFGDVLGHWPALTTAIPLPDVARTKQILALGRAGKTSCQRFSLLTLRSLDKLYQSFSAEELVDVDLVGLNKESLLGLAMAGKVLDKTDRMQERLETERKKTTFKSVLVADVLERLRLDVPDEEVTDEHQVHDGICCVTGYLMNMVERKIGLISPVEASPDYPDGWVVHEETHFDTAADIEAFIAGTIKRHMQIVPSMDQRLLFQSKIKVETLPDNTFQFRGDNDYLTKVSLRNRPANYVQVLSDCLQARSDSGGTTPWEVSKHIEQRFKLSATEVLSDIRVLCDYGALVAAIYKPAEMSALSFK